MSLSLEGMKHILMCFSPFVGSSRSLAEFARRVQSKKVKSTNPDLQVTLKPRLRVMPFVEVRLLPSASAPNVHILPQIDYESGEKQVILTSNRTVDDIVKVIKDRAEQLELTRLKKEAGWDKMYIDSPWGELGRKQRGKLLGYKINAPRDEEEPGPDD